MPERFSFGSPQLSVSGARASARRTEESPFRILIPGDFSGRGGRGIAEPLRGRKPRPVDLDRLDAVMAAIGPQLELELPRGEKLGLTFRKLDDFHPDRIWEQNEFFAPHRRMRAELNDAKSFAAAMASVAPQEGGESTRAGGGDAADLWKQLTELPAAKPPSTPASAADSLIKQALAGHTVAGPDPRQPEMIAAFDNAVSGQMRALLHHPRFQSLEAAWRGVDFLLRHVDTDEMLEVILFDVSRAELAADLRAADSAASGIVDLIVEQPIGSRPWSLVTGLFSFEPDDEDDADLLARLAQVAAAANVPFVAAAGPRSIELAETQAGEEPTLVAWKTVRSLPAARHAGLITPRFLLRLPYGRSTDAIDHFAFEEMPAQPAHESLLWGNPALIAGLLLASMWRDEGWGFAPQAGAEVGGLPVHVFSDSGEKKMTPCSEMLLTDRLAESLLALGVMPLASIRDRDAVRLLRFQSIAQPAAGLAGL